VTSTFVVDGFVVNDRSFQVTSFAIV
jgi:hypothetical protein